MGKVPTDLVDIFENCINRFAHFLVLSFVQSKNETKRPYRIDDEINQKLTVNIDENFTFAFREINSVGIVSIFFGFKISRIRVARRENHRFSENNVLAFEQNFDEYCGLVVCINCKFK